MSVQMAQVAHHPAEYEAQFAFVAKDDSRTGGGAGADARRGVLQKFRGCLLLQGLPV